jgi:hypothetical protein
VIYEVLAVLLAVNMLLLTCMMAFCWKMNKDWSQLFMKINAEWSALYMLIMGVYDEKDE